MVGNETLGFERVETVERSSSDPSSPAVEPNSELAKIEISENPLLCALIPWVFVVGESRGGLMVTVSSFESGVVEVDPGRGRSLGSLLSVDEAVEDAMTCRQP